MDHQVLSRPRIGVPWRTAAEEVANQRRKIDNYHNAVERAGGEAVLLSLTSGADALKREAENLDAFVLTGSPADIDPAHFGAKRHPAAADADAARERTDFTLLEHALAAGKPVLAICYGIQSLNVFLGGSLIQDIPTELGTKICHSPEEDELPDGTETPDAIHGGKPRSRARARALQARHPGRSQLVASPVGVGAGARPAHHGSRAGRRDRGRRMDGKFELGCGRAVASGKNASRCPGAGTISANW